MNSKSKSIFPSNKGSKIKKNFKLRIPPRRYPFPKYNSSKILNQIVSNKKSLKLEVEKNQPKPKISTKMINMIDIKKNNYNNQLNNILEKANFDQTIILDDKGNNNLNLIEIEKQKMQKVMDTEETSLFQNSSYIESFMNEAEQNQKQKYESAKGQIFGLEKLFSLLNKSIEDFKHMIKDNVKKPKAKKGNKAKTNSNKMNKEEGKNLADNSISNFSFVNSFIHDEIFRDSIKDRNINYDKNEDKIFINDSSDEEELANMEIEEQNHCEKLDRRTLKPHFFSNNS